MDRSAVLSHHYAMGKGQTLSCPSARLLGRKERIEDSRADLLGDAGAGVGNANLDAVAVALCAHRDRSLSRSSFAGGVGDGMGRVDEQVQHYLVDFAGQTGDR